MRADHIFNQVIRRDKRALALRVWERADGYFQYEAWDIISNTPAEQERFADLDMAEVHWRERVRNCLAAGWEKDEPEPDGPHFVRKLIRPSDMARRDLMLWHLPYDAQHDYRYEMRDGQNKVYISAKFALYGDALARLESDADHYLKQGWYDLEEVNERVEIIQTADELGTMAELETWGRF